MRSFSRASPRKQRVRVTPLSRRRIIETWCGACLQVEEEVAAVATGGAGCVPDLSAIGPRREALVGAGKCLFLFFSFLVFLWTRVTHVLNMAYRVQNAFLNYFMCKTISILDLPETGITSYFPECFAFIEKVKMQVQ
ncbi:DUS19 phosphatase, partial [Rhynochetos jubatus]|nr:DUS19 phosphatase [Rhynochetos jubatus]